MKQRNVENLVLLSGLAIRLSWGTQLTASPPEAINVQPSYFGGRLGALPDVKAHAASGDKRLQPDLDALRERADRALKVKPPSVTHKTKLGASGNPHDYFSQAPYFWPDPTASNGLPYIARDGRVNPEARTGTSDPERLALMGETVATLALAYYFTGSEDYAAHAARCLRVWFLEPATRMTPHMNFAQAVPGKNSGRGIGIIEAGGLIEAGDAAGLLAGSAHWPAKDKAALRAWLTEFLHWLRTRKNRRDEAGQKNNHGTMYDVRVARLALALGRSDEAKRIIEAAKQTRIATHIEPDGRQPAELRRTKSFNYARLNLRGLCALAVLGEWVGVDLWHFETADGRSIRKALEFMLPYVQTPPKEWPCQQIVPINRSELAGAFRQAGRAYREPRYEAVVQGFPGIERASFQLLNPAPVFSSEKP